MRHQEET